VPEPFLEEFVKLYGRPYDPNEHYHREPFAVDVSEGKTDPLYKAHGYHTKVPNLAIVPSILHYTKPGDIVLDGRFAPRRSPAPTASSRPPWSSRPSFPCRSVIIRKDGHAN